MRRGMLLGLWQPMKIVLAQRRLKHQCNTQAETQVFTIRGPKPENKQTDGERELIIR